MGNKYLDGIIYEALCKRKEIKLFLCRNEEGGFGIKVDGKIVVRNLAWEWLEVDMEESS